MKRAQQKAACARTAALLRVRMLKEQRALIDLSRARQADDIAQQTARTARDRSDAMRDALAGRVENALTASAAITDPDARYAMFVTRARSLHADMQAQLENAVSAKRTARNASASVAARQFAYAQAARRRSGMEKMAFRTRGCVARANELQAEANEIASRRPGRLGGDE